MATMTRAIIISTLLLSLTACEQQHVNQGELRVGLASSPISLDPRFATDAASHKVQELIHCSLIELGEDFLPKPALATSWQHPDPYTWTFLLSNRFTFHDKTPVTAQDVAATIMGIQDQQLSSPLRAGFSSIEKIEAISDTQLNITLSKPDSALLTRLNLGVLPQEMAILPHDARNTVGCGPFKASNWNNSTLTLARSQTSISNIKTIRIETIKDPVTRALKLARNELDFTQNDLPPHLLPWLMEQYNLKIDYQPSTTFSYIGMNMEDAILKDVRIRKALAMALNRNQLKSALFADLPVTGETVLTPKHWAAADIAPTLYNPAQAEALLDTAGYPKNGQGIRFTLNYRTSTNPTRLRLVTAIADAWKKIGIAVNIESLEWGGFYARIKSGDFQVFSLSWVGITDPDIYRWILHSEMQPPKGANRGRYNNPDVDTWLDQATSSENQAELKTLYAKVQQQMAEDQVYIPLWYDAVVAVSGSRLHGFTPQNSGSLKPLLQATLSD